MTDRSKLLEIVRRGPLLRGTQEWDDRELARRSLGCRCLSFGPVNEAEREQRKRAIFYHYMNS